MQVIVEAINSVTKKISIEIPTEQVDSEIKKAYEGIQKKSKIQGFRAGKAPMNIVKRTYGDLMRDQVMRSFYEQTLFTALNEHKIEPVESPTIESELLEQGTPFKYSALIEVMPDVQLKDYTGLAITKEKYVFNQESIDGEIKRMQENMAQLVPLDNTAVVKVGHTITVDYSFTLDGFPEESHSADDAIIEVGANTLMPGLEEQLVGMKCNESKEISIKLPEGYRNPEASGKEGVFQVTVQEIKQKELPELDDEFAQQYGDYDTIEELREKLTEYQQKHENERIENDLKEKIILALVEKNPLEVPQSMVKRQLDHMLENLKNRLKSQQMSIEMMGLDDDGFRKRFVKQAEEKVKGGLLLMALVEKENISVSDEDLVQRYELIAAGNTEMLVRIKDYYSSNHKAQKALVSEIKEDKAIASLLDSAIITEVVAAEQNAA